MDRKTAFELLDISEDATKDDISKKYGLLLKKHHIESSNGTVNSQIDINTLTKAYNYLMGYSDGEDEVESRTSKTKSFGNFLHYHKFHIIITLIILLGLGYFVKSVVLKREPDLKIALIGNIYGFETDTLKSKLQESLPELDNIQINMTTIPEVPRSDFEIAQMGKAQIQLAIEKVDIYILDKIYFDKFVGSGSFANLDDIARSMGIDREANKDYIGSMKDDAQEHLYGVDITESKILSDSKIGGKVKIAVLRKDSKNLDNALKMLELLIK